MGRISHILRPHEWIGLGAGLALAAAIYFALIHPSLQLVGQEEEAAARRNRAERELMTLRTEYQQLQASIMQHQRRLREVGGSPPLATEKDRQIARVTALANECGIKVDQYSPIDTVEQADHQEFLLQFAGRATYAEIMKFFQRIESETEFVDLTHFSITRTRQEGVSECQISWSCRVTGMRPEDLRRPANDPNIAATPGVVQGEGRHG